MAYRLTRGSVSVIRRNAAGVKEAEASGFILDGECDDEGKLLPPRPVEADQPKKAKAAK
ncbi:MAG: hypothetical protein AAGU26_05775 [bacterium]|jgi:hypothetical protein